MTDNSFKAWMSVVEAAEYLGVSKFTMYRAVKGDVVPHTRFGRRILINRIELDRLLQAGGIEDPVKDSAQPDVKGSVPEAPDDPRT